MRNIKWIASLATVALLGCMVVIMNSVEAKDEATSSPYTLDVKPLTTVECGQCHYSVFKAIKDEGGRHQIDCVRCHREYHVYSPRKDNYAQIMPDCAWCHKSATGGAFHGEDKSVTPCLVCHVDPHKPLGIPMGQIESICSNCHGVQGKEIANFPSAHQTEVSCADCHADKHGFIPECSVCHENHSPAVDMGSKECMSCHPVHKPLEIAYTKTTESAICAGCHGDINDMLQAKVTKHTSVACADCHPKHAEIPLCTRCHPKPHPKEILEGFPECSQCHGDPHDLTM